MPTTVDGVAIAAADPGARLRLELTLAAATAVHVWARVRAPTHSHNSLYAAIDELAPVPLFLLRPRIFHFRRQAIQVERSFGCQIFDNIVRDATDWDGNSHGYGVGPTRSQAIVARDNVFRGVMRHPMYISWADRECFYYRNDIERPVEYHPWKSVNIDIHGQDDYANLVEGNRIVRGSTGIVIGGGGSSHGNDGPWNVIRDNEIRETGQGIAVSDHSHDQIVEDNLIVDSGDYGILVRQGSERTHVWRNRIEGWGEIGVFVWDSLATSILGNTITGGPAPVIRIGGSSADYEVRDNDLDGATVDHPDTGTVSDNR